LAGTEENTLSKFNPKRARLLLVFVWIICLLSFYFPAISYLAAGRPDPAGDDGATFQRNDAKSTITSTATNNDPTAAINASKNNNKLDDDNVMMYLWTMFDCLFRRHFLWLGEMLGGGTTGRALPIMYTLLTVLLASKVAPYTTSGH
jgi:hypothetical protein